MVFTNEDECDLFLDSLNSPHPSLCPERVIKSLMAKKIKQFHDMPKFGFERCPVYVSLPLLVLFLPGLKSKQNLLSNSTFLLRNQALFTNELFSATNEDVLPALQKCKVIYQFSCHCDNWYVSRSSQVYRTEFNNIRPRIYPFLLFLSAIGANLPPRLIPSLLLLIQPLDSIFYKILSVLNILMR